MVEKIAVSIVVLLHVYFLILEMFLWEKPKGIKIFGHTKEEAKSTALLAANQGLYNGFLAAGLIWSLISKEPLIQTQVRIFFLGCVLIAGMYGGWSVNRKILFVQAIPAAIAMAFVLF